MLKEAGAVDRRFEVRAPNLRFFPFFWWGVKYGHWLGIWYVIITQGFQIRGRIEGPWFGL